MVNAVGGGPKPAPAKKPEEKKEEKKPESKTPAPSPAPAEKPNTGNTGSAKPDAPKDGLDPKAAFEVSQRLNTKSTGGDGKSGKADEPGTNQDAASMEDIVGNNYPGDKEADNDKPAGSGKEAGGTDKKTGTDKKAGNDDKDTTASEEAARDLLEGLGNKDPGAKKGGKEEGQGENPMGGGAAPTSGKGKPGDTKGENEDKKGGGKPEEKTITKDSALGYVYANFGIFDTGAGIDGADNKFSIKDLNALKDSNVKEVADNAKMLIKEDVVRELGGKDGKISKEDLEGHIEENYDFTKEYKNINFKTDGFSEDELKSLNKQFAFLSSDPDGQILLHNMNNKPGGVTIQKDKEDPDGGGAFVTGDTENGTTVNLRAVRDEGSFLSVVAHEFTHAASTQNGKANDEALASVIGHRIWSRYEGGAEHAFTNDNGDEVTFDGSAKAEEMVYLEELKKRGEEKPESYDAGHGDYLRSLGFEFDFKTNVSNINSKIIVYDNPEKEPEEEPAAGGGLINDGGFFRDAMKPDAGKKPEEGSKEDEHDHDH